MDESTDSQEFSDDYSSNSGDYSSSSDDVDSIPAAQSWTANRPSTSQLPPHTTNRRSLQLPERGSLHSTSDLTHASHANRNHSSRSLNNHSPESRPNSHFPPRPREPAQFDLPDFPLPTASRDNRLPPYSGRVDPASSVFDTQDWSDWDNSLIPPLPPRPASRVSWGSNDSFDLPLHPTLSDFVDLTNANSPPNMPASGDKRRATKSRSTTASIVGSSNKRRKTAAGGKMEKSIKHEEPSIEEVDLRDVDDDDGLSKALQKQQESVIKAQRDAECGKPTKLSGLQCVVCLDNVKDMTATQCGELSLKWPPNTWQVDTYRHQGISSATAVSWKLSLQASSKRSNQASSAHAAQCAVRKSGGQRPIKPQQIIQYWKSGA